MKSIAACCGMAALACALAGPAAAQQIVSTGESFLEARLMIGKQRPDGTREAGLEFVMRDGWKTYWRSPGESGVPPQLDWRASSNLAGVEVAWPRPSVFESFGYTTLGYGGRVVLPLVLVPEEAGRPIRLALNGMLGVCREICVFEEVDLGAEIAPDGPAPDRVAIGIAWLTVPPSGDEAGVSFSACRVAGAGEARRFEAALSLPAGTPEPMVVLEGPDGSWFEDTTVTPAPSGDRGAWRVEATMMVPEAAWLDRSAITTTVLAGPLAAEISGCAPTG